MSGSSKVTPGSCSQHVLGVRAQLTRDPSAPLNQHLYQDTASSALQSLLETLESNKSAIKEWICLFSCDSLHKDVLSCSREKITVIAVLSPGKSWPWGRNYHGRCSVPLFLWGFLAFWAVRGVILLLLVYLSDTGPQEFTNSSEIPFCKRLKSSGVSKTGFRYQHIPCPTLFSQNLAPSCQDELQAVPIPAGQVPN